jgi:hypothetical protein
MDGADAHGIPAWLVRVMKGRAGRILVRMIQACWRTHQHDGVAMRPERTHGWSMSVPVMKVWEMGVVVNERRVPVRVRVWFARRL